jgi:hypothetical protein
MTNESGCTCNKHSVAVVLLRVVWKCTSCSDHAACFSIIKSIDIITSKKSVQHRETNRAQVYVSNIFSRAV